MENTKQNEELKYQLDFELRSEISNLKSMVSWLERTAEGINKNLEQNYLEGLNSSGEIQSYGGAIDNCVGKISILNKTLKQLNK